MKTEIKVTEINRSDIEDLFDTAQCGSYWLGIDYNVEDLLAGKTAVVSDYYAEDETDYYGDKPHRWNEEDECMEYTINVDDVMEGIANALKTVGFVSRCARNYIDECNGESTSFDLYEAEGIMQMVVFGETIYG